jgi:hypothetical protein
MDTISVSCNNCGAPLEVVGSTRFLTCNHCGSRLELHRTGSATYTAVLENIEQHASQIAEDVAAIRVQNELERLDRQWALERETLVMHGQDGRPTEPASGGAGMLVGGLFVGLFVVVCIGMGVSMLSFAAAWRGPNGPGLFALVPLGMAVLVVVAFLANVLNQGQKSRHYTEKKRSYDRQRATLLAQLQQRPSDVPADRDTV